MMGKVVSYIREVILKAGAFICIELNYIFYSNQTAKFGCTLDNPLKYLAI